MKSTATAEQLTLAHEAQAPLPAVQDQEPTSLMALAGRLACEPNFDKDKFEALLAAAERQEARHAEQAFNAAMTAAQTEMRPIAADASNPQTKSKYASYLALDKAMRPIYTRHQFSPSFDTGDGAPEGYVRVLCYLSHGEGHSRTYKIDMPSDGKGAKGGDVMTKTHATGAAVTYGQRYLLKAIFNIAVGDDDDGNYSVDGAQPITDIQLEHIQNGIARTASDVEKLCRWIKVDCLKDIAQRDYPRVMEALNAKPTAKKQ